MRPSFRAPRAALTVASFALGATACVAPRPDGSAPERAAADSLYFPPPGAQWARRTPREVGIDSALLARAVELAATGEIGWLRDMRAQVERNVDGEQYPEILGPVKDRGGPSGMILRHGYVVAEWGDTERVDMTFSVAKSYLSTVAGLAFDDRLIRDVHDPVRLTVDDGGFSSPHNARITWHQLLNQTSEWEGVLWDKPDVADRRAGRERALRQPGTFWEYNDVRVNRLALALLRLYRRPLPIVLRERIMDPIGASPTWEWHGYRNSYVTIDGERMQSVSGGGHWGGGVWASTRDHARFGHLMLRQGRWNGRQLLSQEWVRMATTPTPIKPTYGYVWWLNTGQGQYPAAPASSYFALGAGGNVIWIDPAHDLVAVVRWLDGRKMNEFMGLVTRAIEHGATAGAPAITPERLSARPGRRTPGSAGQPTTYSRAALSSGGERWRRLVADRGGSRGQRRRRATASVTHPATVSTCSNSRGCASAVTGTKFCCTWV